MVSPAKTIEVIKMPFRIWTWLGPRNYNYVLHGIQIPVREGAISRAKGGWPRTCQMVDILKVTLQGGGSTNMVSMPIGVYYMGSHWHHLVNTIELSMCSGNTALCQLALTTCYYYIFCCMSTTSPIMCKSD